MIRRRQEQLVISLCQVRTMKWVHKYFPIKLPELIIDFCGWRYSIGQSCPLLADCFLHTFKLLTEQVRFKSLAIGVQFKVDGSLPAIPS